MFVYIFASFGVFGLFDTGLSKSCIPSPLGEIDTGDRVIVAGQRKGTVKFVGETQFAPGNINYAVKLYILTR